MHPAFNYTKFTAASHTIISVDLPWFTSAHLFHHYHGSISIACFLSLWCSRETLFPQNWCWNLCHSSRPVDLALTMPVMTITRGCCCLGGLPVVLPFMPPPSQWSSLVSNSHFNPRLSASFQAECQLPLSCQGWCRMSCRIMAAAHTSHIHPQKYIFHAS
jgi:hypothetical protein